MKLFFRVVDCLEDAIVNKPVVNAASEHVVHPPQPKRTRRAETTESSTKPTEPQAETAGLHSGQPQSHVHQLMSDLLIVNFYHPPAKMLEGNVFTGVCLSTGCGWYAWSQVPSGEGYPWHQVPSRGSGRWVYQEQGMEGGYTTGGLTWYTSHQY